MSSWKRRSSTSSLLIWALLSMPNLCVSSSSKRLCMSSGLAVLNTAARFRALSHDSEIAPNVLSSNSCLSDRIEMSGWPHAGLGLVGLGLRRESEPLSGLKAPVGSGAGEFSLAGVIPLSSGSEAWAVGLWCRSLRCRSAQPGFRELVPGNVPLGLAASRRTAAARASSALRASSMRLSFFERLSTMSSVIL